MARKEKVEQYLEGGAAVLRRIIAGGGKMSGTFCLVQGRGESALAVFLKKKDPTGAKAKNTARDLKKLVSGSKLAIGIITFENGRLCFRILRGTLKANQAKIGINSRFTGKPIHQMRSQQYARTLPRPPDSEGPYR